MASSKPKQAKTKKIVWLHYMALMIAVLLLGSGSSTPAAAQEDSREAAIEKWARHFEPSAVNLEERKAELRWFAQAAEPFRGRSIKSVAEDINTHFWERDVLAQAFEEITGITVEHEIVGEGTVVERLVEQQSTGRRIYDIYVNDADLVGTHLRSQAVVNLSDYMAGEGKPYTNPYLDLNDFLNLEFGQDYDGNQLQLPDQQFANLYWFRYDWFTRPDIQAAFKAEYGYDLGVPINWVAYEDIAAFFTSYPIDGRKVYGHLDYGRKSPSLGWRFTDAWLSIAGVGDVGLPNGLPVDEWGIRVKERVPVGASVERGGETNGVAAVYALEKYIDWMKAYAPTEAIHMRWDEAGPAAARGDIAQVIFQYTTWMSDEKFHKLGSPVVGADGKPLWRLAPTPHGRYWDEGMKVGYQDAGSWTIPQNVKGPRRAMAWLWAQFSVSKTVELKKFLAGGTPVRVSTVWSDHLTENKVQWGGLIEFYRSADRKKWTGTGPNVPHYPTLSAMWWPNIARAIEGELTPQQAMDTIARSMDEAMARMQLTKYSPQLGPVQTAEYWYAQPGAPKPERPRPQPQTIPYDELLRQWELSSETGQR
jgi:glycerol transport system substrate-binding protein